VGDGLDIDEWRAGVHAELDALVNDDHEHSDHHLHGQLLHLIEEADSPRDAWDAAVALAEEEPGLDLDTVADLIWGDDSEMVVGHGIDQDATTALPPATEATTSPTSATDPATVTLPLAAGHQVPTGSGGFHVDHSTLNHALQPEPAPVTGGTAPVGIEGMPPPADHHRGEEPTAAFGGESKVAASTSSIVPGADGGPPTTAPPMSADLAPPEGFDTGGDHVSGSRGAHGALDSGHSVPDHPEDEAPGAASILSATANAISGAVGGAAETLGDAVADLFDHDDPSNPDATASVALGGLVAGGGLAAALGVTHRRSRHEDHSGRRTHDDADSTVATPTDPEPGAQP
jgi:hypothetical protein